MAGMTSNCSSLFDFLLLIMQ